MKPGGVVIDTFDQGDAVFVKAGTAVGIFLERTPESRSISPGDVVWWAGKYAYWTPRKAPFKNRALKKRAMKRAWPARANE
jgi:hypothetical protein